MFAALVDGTFTPLAQSTFHTVSNLSVTSNIPLKALTAFLVVSGGIGVVSPKALVPVLAVFGLVALTILFRSRQYGFMPRKWILFTGIFLFFATVSTFWSPSPERALYNPAKIALMFVVGFALVASISAIGGDQLNRIKSALAAGVGLGLATIAFGAAYATLTGDALWGSFEGKPLTTLSQGQAYLTVLLWPAAFIVGKKWGPKRASLLIGGTFCLFLPLSNGAVLLAILFASAVFGGIMLWGRKALVALAISLVLGVFAAPAAVKVAPDGEAMYWKLGGTLPSLVHRVYIWNFAVDKTLESPLYGLGFDASRELSKGEDLLMLDTYSIWEDEIMPLHPHNGVLQVWLELGLLGATLLSCVLASMLLNGFRGGANEDRSAQALRASSIVAYVIIGSLSYGVWQNWWIAAGLLCAFATTIAATSETTKPTKQEDIS